MKQRVGIARALAMEPKVLLLDEPFGALDALTRAHLQDLVMAMHQKLGNTVLMITHDVDEAVLLSDRIVMMTNGPAARIGEILDVPLPRPRKRLELAANATYLKCRQRVLEFLYERHRFVEAAGCRRTTGLHHERTSSSSATAWLRRASSRNWPGARSAATPIAVVGEEPRLAYNRVLLSSVLASEISRRRDRTEIRATGGATTASRCFTGTAAAAVDPSIRSVRLAERRDAAIRQARARDRLAADPPARAGHGAAGVHDLSRPRRRRRPSRLPPRGARAVVIGGGLLGLEAAYGLAKARRRGYGRPSMDRLMERQLDAARPHMLKRARRGKRHRRPARRGDAQHCGRRQRAQAVDAEGRHAISKPTSW